MLEHAMRTCNTSACISLTGCMYYFQQLCVVSIFLKQHAQWSNSLEEALHRYGTSHHKAAAISTIDNHCKTSYTLTYGTLS